MTLRGSLTQCILAVRKIDGKIAIAVQGPVHAPIKLKVGRAN